MSSLSSEDETPTRTEAWQCDGTSNDDLVRKLKQAGAFSSHRIAQALSVIDRGDFVRFRDKMMRSKRMAAYADNLPEKHSIGSVLRKGLAEKLAVGKSAHSTDL